jgi:hypothetical protein
VHGMRLYHSCALPSVGTTKVEQCTLLDTLSPPLAGAGQGVPEWGEEGMEG